MESCIKLVVRLIIKHILIWNHLKEQLGELFGEVEISLVDKSSDLNSLQRNTTNWKTEAFNVLIELFYHLSVDCGLFTLSIKAIISLYEDSTMIFGWFYKNIHILAWFLEIYLVAIPNFSLRHISYYSCNKLLILDI